jgi:hypothetical protein
MKLLSDILEGNVYTGDIGTVVEKDDVPRL